MVLNLDILRHINVKKYICLGTPTSLAVQGLPKERNITHIWQLGITCVFYHWISVFVSTKHVTSLISLLKSPCALWAMMKVNLKHLSQSFDTRTNWEELKTIQNKLRVSRDYSRQIERKSRQFKKKLKELELIWEHF